MTDGKYYVGSDLKFQVTITAPGFSQDCDDYNIEFYCGGSHLSFNQNDVISSDGKFYLAIPASRMSPGMMRMIITAYVPDSDFEGGIRKEIAVQNLGYLKSVM